MLRLAAHRIFPSVYRINRKTATLQVRAEEDLLSQLFSVGSLPVQDLSLEQVTSLAGRGFLQVDLKSSTVSLSATGRVMAPVNASQYFQSIPNAKTRQVEKPEFNTQFFSVMQSFECIFTRAELDHLEGLNGRYHANMNTDGPGNSSERRRIIHDYVYHSCRLEEGTYSHAEIKHILDTGGDVANCDYEVPAGMDEFTYYSKQTDQLMALNHNNALQYISAVQPHDLLSLHHIEQTHYRLTEDLGRFLSNREITPYVRDSLALIGGTTYEPPGNKKELLECFEPCVRLITQQTDPYSRSVLTTLLLSYLQLFQDGNKRTARLMGYSMLVNSGRFPIVYDIEEADYISATLLFYERNNIGAYKELFLQMADSSVRNKLL